MAEAISGSKVKVKVKVKVKHNGLTFFEMSYSWLHLQNS